MKQLAIATCVLLLLSVPASAHKRHHRHHHRIHHASIVHVVHGDPRPGAWCGWWMRQYLHVADRSYNLARKWAQYGEHTAGPCVGCLVVWAHHIGIITGRTIKGWIVKSGNDGHAVRERVRRLNGVIAFRKPATV